MAWRDPEVRRIPAGPGELTVGRWGDGSGTPVVASHGITANHRSFGQLAAAFTNGGIDATLWAVDHRGRGSSADHPGPYGLLSHADDLIVVLDAVGLDDAVLVGHSMGAYVAANTAERAPDRVRGLVLVDGALSLPGAVPPPDADVEQLVRAVIGPSLDRLDMTFDSPEAYLDHWRAHPAFAGDAFNDVVEAHLRNDLVAVGDRWRSPVSKDAVLADGRDTLLDERLRNAVTRIGQPTRLLWAPRGMFDQTPGLFPAEVVADVAARLDHLEAVRVDDVNHYTIVFSEHGAEQIAAAVAEVA